MPGRRLGRDCCLQESDRTSTRSSAGIRAESRPSILAARSALTKRRSTAEQALKLAPVNDEAHRVLGHRRRVAKVDSRPRPVAATAGRSARPGPRSRPFSISSKAVDASDRRSRSQRARHARPALSAHRGLRQGHSAPRRSRTPATRVGRWTASSGPGLRGSGPYEGGDRCAWLESDAGEDPRALLPDARRLLRAASSDGPTPSELPHAAGARRAAPRNVDLQTQYAQALLNAGGRDNLGKARDPAGSDLLERAPMPPRRALYLVFSGRSAVWRSPGRGSGCPPRDRRAGPESLGVFRAGGGARSDAGSTQDVVDALAPAIEKFHGTCGAITEIRVCSSMLLPHLGFAHQELGPSRRSAGSPVSTKPIAWRQKIRRDRDGLPDRCQRSAARRTSMRPPCTLAQASAEGEPRRT